MIDEEEIDDSEATGDAVRELIYLRTGEALDADAVAALGASRPYRLIVLAGEPGCGKTTLLASIYQEFLSGPLGRFSFAGSETLVAFERRCHASRAESGHSIPETERTSGATAYLHLRLATDDFTRDVVFTDIPGEDFRLARDLSVEGSRLGYIRRADRFVLLLDGAKLSHAATRQAVVQNARMLLRGLFESGMLDTRSSVAVMFTKADLWRSQPDVRQRTAVFLDAACRRLMDDFAGCFGDFSLHEIAARPESEPPDRDALSAMLEHWLIGDTPARSPRSAPPASFLSTPYERFALFRHEGLE